MNHCVTNSQYHHLYLRNQHLLCMIINVLLIGVAHGVLLTGLGCVPDFNGGLGVAMDLGDVAVFHSAGVPTRSREMSCLWNFECEPKSSHSLRLYCDKLMLSNSFRSGKSCQNKITITNSDNTLIEICDNEFEKKDIPINQGSLRFTFTSGSPSGESGFLCSVACNTNKAIESKVEAELREGETTQQVDCITIPPEVTTASMLTTSQSTTLLQTTTEAFEFAICVSKDDGGREYNLTENNTPLYFTSPNFPQDYGPGASCKWIFKCGDINSYRFDINCNIIDMEDSTNCIDDFLQIKELGRNSQRHCGTGDEGTGEVVHSGNKGQVTVRFESDDDANVGKLRCSITCQLK